MKILLLAETCGAGVGRHVLDLAEGLAGASHEVHLLYSAGRADALFLKRLESYPPGYLNPTSLPLRHAPHPSDLVNGARVRQYVKRHGPFDAIHAHSTKAGLLARTALIGLPGSRIYTPHAPMSMNPALRPLARAVLGGYEALLSQWTDCVVAVSREELEHLHALGIPRGKLAFVPNGIDTGADTPDAGPDRDGTLCVGFLGRLAPQKNLPMLLGAFAGLRAKTARKTFLAIAGAGPEEGELRGLARRLGISSRVRWLGTCDPAVLRTFDVFALPSNYEGMPYVLLEAMAAGLPVVATRVGGVGMLVEDGTNGFTANAGDAKTFTRALGRLLEDGELRNRMGAASRERVAAFTLSRMIEGTLKVYARNAPDASQAFAAPLQNPLKSLRG